MFIVNSIYRTCTVNSSTQFNRSQAHIAVILKLVLSIPLKKNKRIEFGSISVASTTKKGVKYGQHRNNYKSTA